MPLQSECSVISSAIRKPLISPVIPGIPDLQNRSESTAQHLPPHLYILHKSHRGHSDHVDHNKPRQRIAACRRSPDRDELHHQLTGMTDKWFCTLISEGHFPKPIKLGRSSMKRVVMPVRWQCAKCRRWYCGNQPCSWHWRHSREPSSRHSPVSQQFVIIS